MSIECVTIVPELATLSFTILAGAPNLLDNVQLTTLEEAELLVDLSLKEEPPAFPSPIFQWTRNSAPAVNTSGTTYRYPSITFSNISRNDASTYFLFQIAENFIANTRQFIGNATSSFTLNILHML